MAGRHGNGVPSLKSTSRRYAIYARWNTGGYHVKPISTITYEHR